jgi:cytochrome P450
MPEVQSATPPIGSPAFYRNPYRTFRGLLDAGTRAVRLSPGVVAFTHYRDCLDILRDPRLSAKRHIGRLAHYTEEQRRELDPWLQSRQAMMLYMDPPDHPRVRKLLQRAFAPEALATMMPRIEALFCEILDGLPLNTEFDFMQRVAHRFPAVVIGEILGVPPADWRRLMEWSDVFLEFVASFQPPFELARRTNQATVEMNEYMAQLVAVKSATPSAGLISFMVRSQEDGDVLSRDEVLAQCALLLVAGHETTRNLLGNGLLALLRHPRQMDRLRADPGLMRGMVEEALRFDPPFLGAARLATEEVEYCGEKIGAGHVLVCMVGCANRDEHQFPAPDEFDITRRANPQLAFGAGAHACLGMHLARVEAQIAFRALLSRYPKIELREEEPPYHPNLFSRGLKQLRVSFGAQ